MSRARGLKARTERFSPSAGSRTQVSPKPPQGPQVPNENDRLGQASEAARLEEPREHKAVVVARRCLALQKQAVGEQHPDYATGLNQLALRLIMHGNPDHSEPLLRQALAIRRESLGEQHPDFATNLSSLASLLWARGDLDAAEPLMRQALDVRWEVFGSRHPKTLALLNSLEQLLRAKQDWEGIKRLGSAEDDGLAGSSGVAPIEVEAKAAAVPPPSAPDSVVGPDSASPAATRLPLDSEPEPEPEPDSAPSVEPEPDPWSQPVAPDLAPTAAADVAPVIAVGQGREALIARHEALTVQFSRVGEELALEAEQWKSGGLPPTPALIEELDACGRGFEQLRRDVVQLAQSLGTAPDSSRLTSLEELAHLLHVVGELEGRQAQLEAVRGQALATIERVLSLVSTDQNAFAILLECQAKARAVRASVADAPVRDLPEAATRLAEGDHPFHALLTLVERDGLDDDVWASSMETVEAEFGKPLSVAVARSKIIQP